MFGVPFRARGEAAAPRPKRIVVLPFTNLGRVEDEYFAEGVTEEVTARLATSSDLRVIGSTSAPAAIKMKVSPARSLVKRCSAAL